MDILHSVCFDCNSILMYYSTSVQINVLIVLASTDFMVSYTPYTTIPLSLSICSKNEATRFFSLMYLTSANDSYDNCTA